LVTHKETFKNVLQHILNYINSQTKGGSALMKNYLHLMKLNADNKSICTEFIDD